MRYVRRNVGANGAGMLGRTAQECWGERRRNVGANGAGIWGERRGCDVSETDVTPNPTPARMTTMQCRSGELRTQKLKSHLVRTESLNAILLKPGVGQYFLEKYKEVNNNIKRCTKRQTKTGQENSVVRLKKI